MAEDEPEGDSKPVSPEKNRNDEKEVVGSAEEDMPVIEAMTTDANVSSKFSTKKLSRQERAELSQKLQEALSSRNWELAESLLTGADVHALNDALCLSLDSIWFLSDREGYNGLTGLLEKIVSNGASNFTRATLRTSFLGSCVSACQSGTMSLPETVAFVSQRLHERLQECNGTEFLKKEASAKVLKFTEWTMKCIGTHQGNTDRRKNNTLFEVQLQLSAFKIFLDLAGNRLTIRDFNEAFDAACFPLTLFSCSFDPGWATGTSAAVIRGLLGMLADMGADSVNQCLLEAARFGSTEVVRMLLQIARWNGLPVDVNLALSFAAYYSKFGTMECLVEEGHASAFLSPLMNAAEQGCIPVIGWFVERGCTGMELCVALTAAASGGQLAAAAYLLPRVPRHVLFSHAVEILRTTAERGGGSLDGVAFLLSSNFLGSPAETYQIAEVIATGGSTEEGGPASEITQLGDFLRKHWSEAAFARGVRAAEDHYMNFMRVRRRGASQIQLKELPESLVAAIALLPLYRECWGAGGQLLSQRLRGELVGVVRQLLDEEDGVGNEFLREELMAVLERHLPAFFHRSS
ncbi:ankyrin repeat protein SKIP35-like [Iris pallida]|uniref:Ankyrin repeat protein SKIP35-like n=1 Tax=Iris pallida TaxID=29817 RepID=A0AAX6I5W1_IRIPA|nr:ankyrin repeat protein SKIP35-like [Iris pallida]